LPSVLSSHRPLPAVESRAAGQYSLFRPETAPSVRQNQADRPSSQLEQHRGEQRRRIPRSLDRENASSEPAQIQKPGQPTRGNRAQTRRPGVSAPSWQSVPKKLPQSQPPEQERLDDDAGSVEDLSFLRLPDVKALTGLSKTSLYTMIREKSFPAPVRLGPRAVAWVRSEIRRWAAERVRASRSAANRIARLLARSTGSWDRLTRVASWVLIRIGRRIPYSTNVTPVHTPRSMTTGETSSQASNRVDRSATMWFAGSRASQLNRLRRLPF